MNSLPKGRTSKRRNLSIILSICLALIILSPFFLYRLGSLTRSIRTQAINIPSKGLLKELATNSKIPARLVRVIDADTLEVKFTGVEILRVQLLGVDGPEIWRKETKTQNGRVESVWLENVDPMARAGRDKIEEFLQGKAIELEFESGQPPMDNYGRLLAWVWVTGLNREGKTQKFKEREIGADTATLLNEWVIRQGICEYQKGDKLKYEEELKNAQMRSGAGGERSDWVSN